MGAAAVEAGMSKTKRDAIIEFATNNSWSYQLIADRFGVTRSTVAGILFRHRHPVDQRTCSPNSIWPNKVGSGYRTGNYATYTAWNSRP